MDTKEFIERARKIHGDKYDYSKTNYINPKEKVCIICSKHGEFWQKPYNHLNGQGCGKCRYEALSAKYKKTTEQWIKEAREVHGDKYDYSRVEYNLCQDKVCIICPVHGEFFQRPLSHIQGQGCPKCRGKNQNDDFLKKANEIHGNKYDYSKVEYVNNKTKVCIICPIHGEFWQTPYKHTTGQGCPKCAKNAKIDNNEFIERAEKVHNGKYDYSKTEYKNKNSKVMIICPIHGEFEQIPHNHLNGQGCPHCSGNAKRNIESFIEAARKVHGDKYDYSKSIYKGIHEKLCIICPEHGEFWQAPNDHLHDQGCPKCGVVRIWEKRGKPTVAEIKQKLIEKNKDEYDYSLFTNYENSRQKIKVICKKNGVFETSLDNHLQGHGCPSCAHFISKAEKEIYEYICQFIPQEDIIKRDRTVLKGNKELDIYIPKLQIAIEYNGLRWHSEEFNKDKNYHLNKLIECNDKGIKLIQIFEDEWVERKEVVLKKIKHILGFDEGEKIYARKCEIKEIDKHIAYDFLDKNHIQGSAGSTHFFGAFYNDRLVAVMGFTEDSERHWNLTRFATDDDTRCIGIGGKLFKAFLDAYNPIFIKSFADRRWTLSMDNNIYTQLGFELAEILAPDYRYVNGQKREHKFGYRKAKLSKKYGVPFEWTERKMTEYLGFYRIYDCGLLRYEWHKKEEED